MKKSKTKFNIHFNNVSTISLLPNGNIVTASKNSIKIWNINNYLCLKTQTTGNKSPIRSMMVLRNGTLITASLNSFQIWNTINELECIKTMPFKEKYKYFNFLTILTNGYLTCSAQKVPVAIIIL
jgi:WD40 repeat protein